MTPFELVGIHWRGPGALDFRVQRAAGRWSVWRTVVEDEGDAPEAGSAEARATRGWRLGAPVWVGKARRVEVRVHGRVARARALTVRSPVSKVPLRVTTTAGAPKIVPRSA